MQKPELRDRYIELRSDMSQREVLDGSAAILTMLKRSIDWPSVARVHMYASVNGWNEVRTEAIAEFLKNDYPSIERVTGIISRSAPPAVGGFDVILVPLLAFDDNLNRLGFGGGWYDRFLANQPGATKIGLAYDFQRAESIPVGSYDIPMDMIITETGVFKKSASRL